MYYRTRRQREHNDTEDALISGVDDGACEEGLVAPPGGLVAPEQKAGEDVTVSFEEAREVR